MLVSRKDRGDAAMVEGAKHAPAGLTTKSRAGVRRTVVIVDEVQERRNAVYRTLRTFAHPIPVDTIDELASAWPEDAWFLVYDNGDQLERVMGAMDRMGSTNPVVVYSQNACISAAIAAVHCGAVNFVSWPCGEAELERAMSEVAESPACALAAAPRSGMPAAGSSA